LKLSGYLCSVCREGRNGVGVGILFLKREGHGEKSLGPTEPIHPEKVNNNLTSFGSFESESG